MDSLKAMQLIPPARTFWNSNDPSLDPFDETLMPTIASPLEAACSSTFLFPSTTGSTCDSGDSQVFLKTPLESQQQSSMIFDEILIPMSEEDEGAESSRGLNISTNPGLDHNSTVSSWLPAPPAHGYHSGFERGQVRVHLNHNFGGSQLGPDLFGSLNASTTSTASDSSHVSKNHTSGPLMRHPSFRRPDNAGLLKQQQQQQRLYSTVKASWQSINIFQEFPRRSGVVSLEEPLGSPCSVISGFTNVADRFLSTDCNTKEISSSSSFAVPSTSAAANRAANALDHEAAGKYGSRHNSRESSTPGEGGAHSMSGAGAQEIMRVNQLTTRRKRSKLPKLNNDEESQRMTHIAVERNRRKQMNEHLAALRALMPGSYVQKGDQASIVGGAIEFVKELEHLLHCLQSQKRRRAYSDLSTAGTPTSRLGKPNPEPQSCQSQPPFAFHSPQRLVDPSPFLLGASSTESMNLGAGNIASTRHGPQLSSSYGPSPGQMISIPATSSSPLQPWSLETGVVVGEAHSDMASVEVKLVPSGSGSSSSSDPAAALVKIMATRRAGQLLRTVVALESLALTVLHTNITTVGDTVLYSFHVQMGALCCTNVNEIACAIHQTFASLHALQFQLYRPDSPTSITMPGMDPSEDYH